MIYVEATEKYRQLRSQVETGVNEYFSGLLGTLDPEERSCVSRGLELVGVDHIFLQEKEGGNRQDQHQYQDGNDPTEDLLRPGPSAVRAVSV